MVAAPTPHMKEGGTVSFLIAVTVLHTHVRAYSGAYVYVPRALPPRVGGAGRAPKRWRIRMRCLGKLGMLIFGLTGGIATGKSTVSDILSELGCPVIDTDVLARRGKLTFDFSWSCE